MSSRNRSTLASSPMRLVMYSDFDVNSVPKVAATPLTCPQQSSSSVNSPRSKHTRKLLMSNLAQSSHENENVQHLPHVAPLRPASAQSAISSTGSHASSVKGFAPGQREIKLSTSLNPMHIRYPPISRDGVGAALSDTPEPSQPSSPYISAMKHNPTNHVPRPRPTTLDIPGLTKSKVSPDGKIAQRDVGSKLVIAMVGLPARGKSYITKKMARYLNWAQHDTRIFNVGERRRIAASDRRYRPSSPGLERIPSGIELLLGDPLDLPHAAARILVNGNAVEEMTPLVLSCAAMDSNGSSRGTERADRPGVVSPGPEAITPPENNHDDSIDQSASFFDPSNLQAAQIREQCAMDTLDDLLDWILKGSGSVGIFDATNSTLARRQQIMEKIRQRAGPELNVLFVESVCQDQTLLESNMRLKLSGPDYADKDPVAALEDFKQRVAIYEKNYVPLGDYEEENNMSYVRMIDVGRKMVSHQVKGFLAGQAVYYLLNFNLAPRMIWVTRHGESEDNVAGKIGGDSNLTASGRKYAQAMTRFIEKQRTNWAVNLADKIANTHFPPQPGDHTPPNPYYGSEMEQKSFCVWSSMLKRSVQSAQYFCEDEYDLKQMRMLDELNAGQMEGLTYQEIKDRYSEEYELRRADKIAYRYPGPGGEGYLDIINRIRPVIFELERMTDHCLLITHRSIARVLLAYFQGLKREDVAEVDCPLGMLYQMEPKPYGVEFKAWKYNSETDDFDHMPDFKLQRAISYH